MSRVMFLPFALEAAVATRATPLPYPVAARQLPRLLAEQVAALGSAAAWDATYMPIVGRDHERRGFVAFDSHVPLEQVEAILGPVPLPDVLIEGRLTAGHVSLRATAPLTREVLLDRDQLPFDPADPRIAIYRLTLEVWDVLDLAGRPPPAPELPPPALCFLLIGRDEELALAANLTRQTPASPFVPFLAALQHAPADRGIWEAMLATARLVVEQQRGDPRDAARSLARAAQGGTAPLSVLREALALARAAGDGEAVERLAMPLLRAEPGEAELCLLVAASLVERGELAGARELLRRWALASGARSCPQAPHLLALLIRVSSELGEDRDADRWAHELLELGEAGEIPSHAVEVLARRLAAQARHLEALELIDRALARDPGAAFLHLERGRMLMQLRRPAEACAAFDLARGDDELTRLEAERLRRFAHCPEMLDAIDDVEQRIAERDPRGALRRARRIARAARTLPEAWYVLGLAHAAAQHRRRAVRALSRALELLPELAEARNRRGILLVSLGHYRRGYEDLARVVAQRDGQLAPMLHLAQACYYLSRFDEGAALMARAERLFPGHPAVQETRATFFPATSLDA